MLTGLLLTVGLVVFSCQSRKQATHQEKDSDLTFKNAFKGLPTTGQWRQGIDFGDLNGDGHMDIFAPPPRKAAEKDALPHVWYGDGQGEWTLAELQFPENLKYDYGTIAVDDFDGDGHLDMALAMHVIGLRVLRGIDGRRFEDFSKGLPSREEFVSRAVIAGQVGTGPKPDLVAVSEARFGSMNPAPSGVWVCRLRETGWSCKPVGERDVVEGLYADQLASGDVDGDGSMDLAVASRNAVKPLIIWVNDGKGNFSPFNEGLPNENVIFPFVTLVDINEDGRDDLVTCVSGFGRQGVVGIKAFLSRPDGWKESSKGLPAGVFQCVDACDLDHNGTPEIVAGTFEGGIQVFSFESDGWAAKPVSGLPESGLKRMFGIYCVDLNGDGYKDIAVNYASSKDTSDGGIKVFLNQPNS